MVYGNEIEKRRERLVSHLNRFVDKYKKTVDFSEEYLLNYAVKSAEEGENDSVGKLLPFLVEHGLPKIVAETIKKVANLIRIDKDYRAAILYKHKGKKAYVDYHRDSMKAAGRKAKISIKKRLGRIRAIKPKPKLEEFVETNCLSKV